MTYTDEQLVNMALMRNNAYAWAELKNRVEARTQKKFPMRLFKEQVLTYAARNTAGRARRAVQAARNLEPNVMTRTNENARAAQNLMNISRRKYDASSSK